MTTESHLASLGVTMQQAKAFILSHINEPLTIYQIALDNEITTVMLSEITGASTNVIRNYFNSKGFSADLLDLANTQPTNLPSLNSFIALNENTGILSNEALQESIAAANQDDPFFNFDLNLGFWLYLNDSPYDDILSPEEFNGTTAHLGNLPATAETIKSLYFGTIINELKSIDEEEVQQISDFYAGSTIQFTFGPDDGTPSGDLFSGIFNTPTSNPYFSDEQIAEIAISMGSNRIQSFELIANDYSDGLGHDIAEALIDYIVPNDGVWYTGF